MTRQRLATLLRLEVSVSRSGFWVAVIQHVTDQVQRSPILGKPRADSTAEVMDADILQSRPFADAPQRFTETRQVRAGLEAANDVRIPVLTRNEFETTDRGGSLVSRLLFVCEEWMAKRYDLLKVYPDAKDLFDLSFSAVRKMYVEFQELLFELLNETRPSGGLDCTTRELALCIGYALRGFKEMAVDSDEFRRLIRIQIRLVVCALGHPAQRRADRRNAVG